MIDSKLLSEISIYAEEIAKQCSEILRNHQKKIKILNQKDEVDIATDADIASESHAIQLIQKKYAQHSIYSEEAGLIKKDSNFVWYIDPLDGTKEYIRGLTEYNCLLSVEYKNQTVVGVIWRNGIGEVYTCVHDRGAYLNKHKIRVSKNADLEKSFIGFHMPEKSSGIENIEHQLDILKKLVYRSYRVRPGSDDAKQLGYVARGALEAHFIPSGLKTDWHDVAAGLLLVKEAGGKVTNWLGNPLQNHDMSKGIVASNGLTHSELIKLILH